MTILPTNRPSATTENKAENGQIGSMAKSRREHAHSAANGEVGESGNRRTFRRSATPEQTERCLRKFTTISRFKQAKENLPEPVSEENISGKSSDHIVIGETVNIKENENIDSEEATGFNSEDEYDTPSRSVNSTTKEDWISKDKLFVHGLSGLGYEVKEMNEDGACLFRAIADQIFGDQELHYMVRTSCMDYIEMNKDYFAPYVTEDFDKYIARKRTWNVHGNHLEIQAMSEMYNRTIEVYCYEIKPINIFNGSRDNAYEPIRISYHRMCHYNSVINPNNPSVGVGLGLPTYHPIDLNRRRVVDAVRASEELLIEQTMLEDKLKATDWEATSDALEKEVARESYIQYLRDIEKRQASQGHVTGNSSTTNSSPKSNSRRGSTSPKGRITPKRASPKTLRRSPRSSTSTGASADLNPKIQCGLNSDSDQSPKSQISKTYENRLELGFDYTNICDRKFSKETTHNTAIIAGNNITSEDNWDDIIMAQILDESRTTYFEDLKRNSKKQSSPGPSTSR